jgi:hypothetical protein
VNEQFRSALKTLRIQQPQTEFEKIIDTQLALSGARK